MPPPPFQQNVISLNSLSTMGCKTLRCRRPSAAALDDEAAMALWDATLETLDVGWWRP
jgi:hypothetical protein